VKSLVVLLEHLLLDCGRRCAAPTRRDVVTLRARVDHEGDSFLTITLPAFCQGFERCLGLGKLDPVLFASFKKRKDGTPAFLQGFLFQVFDLENNLLDRPSVEAIRAIRQICLFAKKILRPCTPKREAKAAVSFVRCDDEVATELQGQLGRYFSLVSSIIVDELGLTRELLLESVPKHGPGATQERIRGNAKWRFLTWPLRFEEVGYTYFTYGRVKARPYDIDWPTFVDPGDEEPVRVVFVPKTLKTPRVIAVEPVAMQYAQQGLASVLVKQLERCFYTAGHLNFKDQAVNQVHALRGSCSGLEATLDMSEASDRVSLAHADECFAAAPDFREWLLAFRSTRARLPNGDVIALKKFASMGSALCFPVEALIFFISIIASRCLRAGWFPDARNVYSLGRDVFVYGDDIIVPAGEAASICDDLETLGFMVNRRKSFWTGKFRESCGVDAYDGEKVTPVYLRRDVPADRDDASGILSSVATANQLEKAGYTSTAAALGRAVEKLVGRLPQVDPEGPAIGWHGYSEAVPRERWNRHLQRREILAWVPVSSEVDDPLDGLPAFAKCLRKIKGGFCPSGLESFQAIEAVSEEHLEVSSKPYGLALKRRWVPQSN
jgi:hypothetical protein